MPSKNLMKRKSKCDSDILMINKNISILHVAMCRRINNKSFVCIVIQTWKRIFSSLILSCFNPVKQQYLQHQKCKKCVTIPLCCYCNTVKIQSYISTVFIILYYVKYCWDILRDESSNLPSLLQVCNIQFKDKYHCIKPVIAN